MIRPTGVAGTPLALMVTLLTILPVGAGPARESGGQQACPRGTAPRADLGLRYRFTAGDFVKEDGRPRWIHFLTEPTVVEVEPDGPAGDRLAPGDVIVAVDGQLITTSGGSFRLWFSHGDSLRVQVARGDRPVQVWIVPRVQCVAF